MNNVKNFDDVAKTDFYSLVMKPFYTKLTEAETVAYLMLTENETFKKIYKDSFKIRTLYDMQSEKIRSQQLVLA